MAVVAELNLSRLLSHPSFVLFPQENTRVKILRVDDTLPKELFEKLQRADKVKVAVSHSTMTVVELLSLRRGG